MHDTIRLTDYTHGGGCACKIPPGELEDAVRGLTGQQNKNVLVGLDDGDDAAAVLVRDGLAVLSTADFFTPVVDDAYDWGRIAAANRCRTCTPWAAGPSSRSTWSAGRAACCPWN